MRLSALQLGALLIPPAFRANLPRNSRRSNFVSESCPSSVQAPVEPRACPLPPAPPRAPRHEPPLRCSIIRLCLRRSRLPFAALQARVRVRALGRTRSVVGALRLASAPDLRTVAEHSLPAPRGRPVPAPSSAFSCGGCGCGCRPRRLEFALGRRSGFGRRTVRCCAPCVARWLSPDSPPRRGRASLARR